MNNDPVRETMCGTCPFKEGSKYAFLQDYLTTSALTEASRKCHSTGVNAIAETTVPPHLCRGARDKQLQLMHAMGVIEAETDEAWNKTRVKFGMEPIVTKDPEGA